MTGVMVESSTASASSKERAPFRRFGRWGLSAMAETRGDCEKAVQAAGRKPNPTKRDGWPFCHNTFRANRPILSCNAIG